LTTVVVFTNVSTCNARAREAKEDPLSCAGVPPHRGAPEAESEAESGGDTDGALV
jgi:hypothetical protein